MFRFKVEAEGPLLKVQSRDDSLGYEICHAQSQLIPRNEQSLA